MSETSGKTKVNVTAFLNDYVRGEPDSELMTRHSLTKSQLLRVIGVLHRKGQIASKDMEQRDENLKIRFGGQEKAPQPQVVEKKQVDVDTGLVLHCPSCGASVERDSERCDYCNSPLDFSLKGKTIDCPHCYKRTPADGRFCVQCARPLPRPTQEQGSVLDGRACPRCQLPLRMRNIGDFGVMGCDQCGGLFISHETFEMMQDTSERVIISTGRPQAAAVKLEKTISYVRCPVCGVMMNRKNFAGMSGAIVDICGYHGIWFDYGELEKIMDFVARGGLQKARAREEEELGRLENARMKISRDSARYGGSEYPPMLMSSSEVSFGDLDIVSVVGELFNLFRK